MFKMTAFGIEPNLLICKLSGVLQDNRVSKPPKEHQGFAPESVYNRLFLNCRHYDLY